MARIPKDRGLDSTAALLREGYVPAQAGDTAA